MCAAGGSNLARFAANRCATSFRKDCEMVKLQLCHSADHHSELHHKTGEDEARMRWNYRDAEFPKISSVLKNKCLFFSVRNLEIN